MVSTQPPSPGWEHTLQPYMMIVTSSASTGAMRATTSPTLPAVNPLPIAIVVPQPWENTARVRILAGPLVIAVADARAAPRSVSVFTRPLVSVIGWPRASAAAEIVRPVIPTASSRRAQAVAARLNSASLSAS